MGLLFRRLRERRRLLAEDDSRPPPKPRKRARARSKAKSRSRSPTKRTARPKSRTSSRGIPTMAMNWAKSMAHATGTPLKQVLKSTAFEKYLKILKE